MMTGAAGGGKKMAVSARSLCAIAVAAMCAVACSGGAASAGTARSTRVRPTAVTGTRPGDWRVMARIAVPGRAAFLQSVTAAGTSEAWAAGVAVRHGKGSRLLLERWSAARWRPIAVPGALQSRVRRKRDRSGIACRRRVFAD